MIKQEDGKTVGSVSPISQQREVSWKSGPPSSPVAGSAVSKQDPHMCYLTLCPFLSQYINRLRLELQGSQDWHISQEVLCFLSRMTVHNAFKSRKKGCQNLFKIYQSDHFLNDKQMASLSYSEGECSFSFVHLSFYGLKELVFNPNSKIVN